MRHGSGTGNGINLERFHPQEHRRANMPREQVEAVVTGDGSIGKVTAPGTKSLP
jgi:hypothetical protein